MSLSCTLEKKKVIKWPPPKKVSFQMVGLCMLVGGIFCKQTLHFCQNLSFFMSNCTVREIRNSWTVSVLTTNELLCKANTFVGLCITTGGYNINDVMFYWTRGNDSVRGLDTLRLAQYTVEDHFTSVSEAVYETGKIIIPKLSRYSLEYGLVNRAALRNWALCFFLGWLL